MFWYGWKVLAVISVSVVARIATLVPGQWFRRATVFLMPFVCCFTHLIIAACYGTVRMRRGAVQVSVHSASLRGVLP
jgi:hypothetical protein